MSDDRDRGLHRHGKADPSDWDQRPAFADRAQRDPEPNTTMGERRAARTGKPAKAATSEAPAEVSGPAAEDEPTPAPKRRRAAKTAAG